MNQHNLFWLLWDVNSSHTHKNLVFKSRHRTNQRPHWTPYPKFQVDCNFENSLCRSAITFKDHVKDLLLKTIFYFSRSKTQVQDLKFESCHDYLGYKNLTLSFHLFDVRCRVCAIFYLIIAARLYQVPVLNFPLTLQILVYDSYSESCTSAQLYNKVSSEIKYQQK